MKKQSFPKSGLGRGTAPWPWASGPPPRLSETAPAAAAPAATDAAPAPAAPAPPAAEAAACAAELASAKDLDFEAYMNNTAPVRLTGIPGPGHNAFLMVCAALVLFMTLPGLALFYGGLVRTKNVLSVLAQCMGIAGLVTLLWWAVGYSFAFASGTPFLGGLKFAFLQGVGAGAQYGLLLLGFAAASSPCTS